LAGDIALSGSTGIAFLKLVKVRAPYCCSAILLALLSIEGAHPQFFISLEGLLNELG
jgi:hypothetical protein